MGKALLVAAACVWSCAAALAGAPAEDVPRLHTRRVLRAYPPETKLVFSGGALWDASRLQPPDVPSGRPERKRLLLDARGVLEGCRDAKDRPNPFHFRAVDRAGRRWFLLTSSRDRVRWIVGGKVHTQQLGAKCYSTTVPGLCETWPGRVGENILVTDDGVVWIAALDRLWRFADGQWREIRVPAIGPEMSPTGYFGTSGQPHHRNRLFADGENVWWTRGTRTNCGKKGSFLLHCTPHAASVVHRVFESHISAVVRSGRDVAVLLEKPGKEKLGKWSPLPETHLRFRLKAAARKLPAERIARLIEQLDADQWKTRQQATDALSLVSPSQIPLLTAALDKAKSLERKARLQTAIRRAGSPGLVEPVETRDEALCPTTARLVFVSRAGRQYLQPYESGKPQPRLRVVARSGEKRELRLPSASVRFQFQADAKAPIYVFVGQSLCTLDDRTGKLREMAKLGAFSAADTKLIAAGDGGKVCLSVRRRADGSTSHVYLWLDLKQSLGEGVLPGKAIAEMPGVAGNSGDRFRATVGPKGRLWFLQYRKTPKEPPDWVGPGARALTALCRANGRTVEKLTAPTPTGLDPSVWPIGRQTALVVTTSGNDNLTGNVLYDAGRIDTAVRLKDLIDRHYARLIELLPNGAAYQAGPYYRRAWLVRLGDGLLLRGSFFTRKGGGCGTVWGMGIRRRDGWTNYVADVFGPDHGRRKPLLNRLVATDPATGRALAFTDGCKVLKWIPVASDSQAEEVLLTRSRAFAWRWQNNTHLPRLNGVWTLTPKAADRWVAIEKRRLAQAKAGGKTEWDIQYDRADFAAVRRWTKDGWRVLQRSLYGGSVHEDAAGGVWLFRKGEVAVFLPDGRRQIFEMATMAPYAYGHLAVEAPDAVWIASADALWRMTLLRGREGKPQRWRVDRKYSLLSLGLDFAGPWISGQNVYYASKEKLYHTTLPELIHAGKSPASRPAATTALPSP